MVGADLANLANEAALLAARRNHHAVQTADFTDSLEKILLGAPRGIVLSPADRERTAYHEAGHALVGMLTPGADPVRKVSIIPRGAALGVTLSAPDDDQVSYTREDLIGKIKVALGGRVAEEIGLRHDHDRSRIRHRTGHGDRPADGRPLGHERSDRLRHGHPRRGTRSILTGASETSEATQQVDRRAGPRSDRFRSPRRHGDAQHPPRATRVARQRAARRTRRSTRADAYAAAGMPIRPPSHVEHRVAGHVDPIGQDQLAARGRSSRVD